MPSPPPAHWPPQPPWAPANEYKDTTPTNQEDGNPLLQYYSYWVEMEVLVPATSSRLEEHPDAEQGKSTFENTHAPPSTPSGHHTEVGALKTPKTPPEGDGGGLVPLWPGEGGRSPSAPPRLVTPGTSTVWDYDPTTDEWTADTEFVDFTQKDPTKEPSALPTDVNRVVEVPDVNNDGVKDLVICTEHGAYVVRSDGDTGDYHPPVLLSDENDNVRDVVALKYNPEDEALDFVVVTDGATPNKIYYGDPRDPELELMGRDVHAATGTTENPVGGVPGEPVGGLRHKTLEDPALPPGSFKDSVRVVLLDTDGVDGDDSFVIANVNEEDQVFFKGDESNPWTVGSATTTTDIATFSHNTPGAGTGWFTSPHDRVKIVFAKEGVDEWVTIPLANYGPNGDTPNPTDVPAAVPGAPNRHTHTVEVANVKAAVYGSTEDASRLYFGYDQTTPDETLGSYLHNPGATMTDIVSGLTSGSPNAAPNLLGTTMEVVALKENHPPSVIFGTSGGTQVVVTQHDLTAAAPFSAPVYDGSSGNHQVKLLKASGEASVVLDPTATKDQVRDVEASHGLLLSADFNGDGYPDTLSGMYTVLSKQGFYDDASGEETYQPQPYYHGPPPLGVVATDYDGDSDVDLVVLTRKGALVKIPNDGSGVFSTLPQRREAGNNAPITDLEAFDPAKTPRVIALSNGDIAIAKTSSVEMYDYDPATGLYVLGTTVALGGSVLDMKAVAFSG